MASLSMARYWTFWGKFTDKNNYKDNKHNTELQWTDPGTKDGEMQY